MKLLNQTSTLNRKLLSTVPLATPTFFNEDQIRINDTENLDLTGTGQAMSKLRSCHFDRAFGRKVDKHLVYTHELSTGWYYFSILVASWIVIQPVDSWD